MRKMSKIMKNVLGDRIGCLMRDHLEDNNKDLQYIIERIITCKEYDLLKTIINQNQLPMNKIFLSYVDLDQYLDRINENSKVTQTDCFSFMADEYVTSKLALNIVKALKKEYHISSDKEMKGIWLTTPLCELCNGENELSIYKIHSADIMILADLGKNGLLLGYYDEMITSYKKFPSSVLYPDIGDIKFSELYDNELITSHIYNVIKEFKDKYYQAIHNTKVIYTEHKIETISDLLKNDAETMMASYHFCESVESINGLYSLLKKLGVIDQCEDYKSLFISMKRELPNRFKHRFIY